MTELPFTPFSPLTQPSQTPEADAPPAGKRKKKASALPAPETPAPATPKPARKPRAVKPLKPAPKFDLQTILRATAGMKEDDLGLFQKMVGDLQSINESQRTRVLEGLSKVFA